MDGPLAALAWRPLVAADLPALAELAGVCLAVDGGQPFAASADFLQQRYLSGAETRAWWDGGDLICVSALRCRQPPAAPGGDPQAPTVTTGLVHPRWRRRGIGGQAFGWAAGRAGQARLRAESEALSDGAHALYLAQGLSLVLAEDVMRLAEATPLPAVRPPAGLVLSTWGQADPVRFFAVYHAAFRGRPGFPDWPEERWIEWIADDEDFRPEWTLLATLGGADVGFIAGEAPAWITQVGVVPSARGRDVGAVLVTETARRMRSAGETAVTLNVNIDNPHAAALYRRIGFGRVGRRARYETSPP